MSTSGVSRRELALAFAVASASVAAAQQSAAPAEDLLGSAREQVKNNGETLRNFKVPTATEPSFTFHP